MPLGNWFGDRILANWKKQVRRRLSAAAIYLAADIKASISQGGGINLKKTTKSGKLGASRERIYHWTHSLPGNPPFRQTGHLRRSITWELVGETTARVGTNLGYGKHLEKGAPAAHLAARPYLAPRLAARQQTLARMITTPLAGFGAPAYATAGLAGSFAGSKAGRGQTAANLKRLAAETTPLLK